jgi:hypothetical protein
MPVSFADRLGAVQRANRSTIALVLSPRLLQIPLPMQRFDDPFLPFGKAVIAATREIVCAYVFDLAAYLAIGAAGAVALERTIAYAGANGDNVTILHGPFASPNYAEAVGDNAFNVDAVTLVDEQYLAAYTASEQRGAFVIRRGESPVIIPLPGNAGVYWQDAGIFTMLSPEGHTLQMQAAGEKVLYAGRGDDFAERVRAALEAMR